MSHPDSDPSQNPYRSPIETDEGSEHASRLARKRTRDMALVGMFLGLSYGAATGTAITVSLDGFQTLVQLMTERESFSVYARVEQWMTYFVAVAALGALLGSVNGAALGYVQGWLAAHPLPLSTRWRQGGAAFCWASVAAIWCLLIDQKVLSSGSRTWIVYLALLVAPSAAGCTGAQLAKRLGAQIEP